MRRQFKPLDHEKKAFANHGPLTLQEILLAGCPWSAFGLVSRSLSAQ